MIGKIKGMLTEAHGNVGLIETSSGISYEIYIPPTLVALAYPSPIEVYTHLQVRDDAHVLFGFEDHTQLSLYRMLISVSGVGPKIGFAIICNASTTDIIAAIKQNDVAFFHAVPGLGKKTAMKLLVELSGKLDSEFELSTMLVSDDDKTVVDALIALGYKAQDAKTALTMAPKELSVEDKIKFVLAQSLQR